MILRVKNTNELINYGTIVSADNELNELDFNDKKYNINIDEFIKLF